MKNMNDSHESRELKAVSIVIATLALPVYGSAAALDGWDARVVSLYVGSVMLLVAGGVRLYATHPSLFGSTTTGDRLRTHYGQPAAAYVEPGVARDVSHPKVWTRSYAALVTRQAAATLAFLAAYISVTVGVTLGLGQAGGPMLFIAALLILAVFFVMGRSFVVSSNEGTPALQDTDPRQVPLRPTSATARAGHRRAA